MSTGHPSLSLQESFILFRGKQDYHDRGPKRDFKGGRGFSLWVCSGWHLERWNSANAIWLVNLMSNSPTLTRASALIPPPFPVGTLRAEKICWCLLMAPHRHQTGRKRGGWDLETHVLNLVSPLLFLAWTFYSLGLYIIAYNFFLQIIFYSLSSSVTASCFYWI